MLGAVAAAAAALAAGADAGVDPQLVAFSDGVLDDLILTDKGRLPCVALEYVVSHRGELVPLAQRDGSLILEFGVWEGRSVNLLGKSFPERRVHGFDSFQGLPVNWDAAGAGLPDGTGNLRAGHFSLQGRLPKVRPNVELHKGWFNDTLPRFLDSRATQSGAPVALLHVDSDLYVSASQVLTLLATRIVPGTTIVFDELVGYTRFMDGEMKALFEFMESATHLAFEVIGGNFMYNNPRNLRRQQRHGSFCLQRRPAYVAQQQCQAVAIRVVSAPARRPLGGHVRDSRWPPRVAGFCPGRTGDTRELLTVSERRLRLEVEDLQAKVASLGGELREARNASAAALARAEAALSAAAAAAQPVADATVPVVLCGAVLMVAAAYLWARVRRRRAK
eukprot:TRINITY_DN30709_c0_g1_i2.p1 TRINITY_DN30709_c0_g1~~TRINITY_DN30709_c0_g1_i2.p1  ORF type:complete len:414 (+),score=91.61 TRINITY_DN30709_c0_g1_i2:71-1243(+)